MQQLPSIPAGPPAATQQYNGVIQPKSSGGWRGVLSTIGILIAAPIIALALTAFMFQSYEVDGPSMETTLQNRDRLIVWKLPRSISRLTKNAYVPHRYDIVIFVKRGLSETSGNGDKQLIKRVIGLPGDHLVIKDNQITIYNQQNPNGFNPDINHEFSQNITDRQQFFARFFF